ncbi:MAG: response regulator [Magnetococcales bacterium]|nr:response regulator [Magnetococcales bacterium]NGZ26430.1 response regulator [Magnetococcales bacterium]
MAGQHILVVDDDMEICRLVGNYLEKNGYQVTFLTDGSSLFDTVRQQKVDLVVLDWILPGNDGLNLCRLLRNFSNVPVIMLSSKGEETDRILGLEMGADDYLAKPFSNRELLARVRSVIRRSKTTEEQLQQLHMQHMQQQADQNPTSELDREVIFRFGQWVFEVATRRLRSSKGEFVSLSGGEFAMLLTFLNHPNQVLSRDELLDLTRGRESEVVDRTIDMQVSRLRKQLRDDPQRPAYIKTVRNTGYIFCASVQVI